jgi:hypothetical protein
MSKTPETDIACYSQETLHKLCERLECQRNDWIVRATNFRRRLRFLQFASAETLNAMSDWSDESIDAELAKEGGGE